MLGNALNRTADSQNLGKCAMTVSARVNSVIRIWQGTGEAAERKTSCVLPYCPDRVVRTRKGFDEQPHGEDVQIQPKLTQSSPIALWPYNLYRFHENATTPKVWNDC